MEPEKSLNPRQKKFLAAYLVNGGNATAAAREAGYANARVEGYRLTRVPAISAAIKEHLDAAAMSAEEVLARLADHARGDLADFIDIGRSGRWKLDLKKAEKLGLLHLVKKISYDRKGNPTLELHDAQAALQLLAKHHGLLTEKVEHSGTVRIEDVLGSLDPESAAGVRRALTDALRPGGGGARAGE
jgi:hypothetical protein